MDVLNTIEYAAEYHGLYKAHKFDSGFDVCSAEDQLLEPGDIKMFATGIKIDMRPIGRLLREKYGFGIELQIRPRSGLAANHGIVVFNSPATIDETYIGEVKVLLVNHSRQSFGVKRGDRIAQFVFSPVFNNINLVLVQEISDAGDTERGEKGFGSSGTKKQEDLSEMQSLRKRNKPL